MLAELAVAFMMPVGVMGLTETLAMRQALGAGTLVGTVGSKGPVGCIRTIGVRHTVSTHMAGGIAAGTAMSATLAAQGRARPDECR